MIKLIGMAVVAFLAFGILGCLTPVHAETATEISADNPKPVSEGRARQKACAEEWKAEKAKADFKPAPKGSGRSAWLDFRAACTVRHGGKSKRFDATQAK